MTPPTKSEILRALRLTDHAAWAQCVRDALRAAHGNRARAAISLGVHKRTLERWLRVSPALADGIALQGPGAPSGESQSQAVRRGQQRAREAFEKACAR